MDKYAYLNSFLVNVYILYYYIENTQIQPKQLTDTNLFAVRGSHTDRYGNWSSLGLPVIVLLHYVSSNCVTCFFMFNGCALKYWQSSSSSSAHYSPLLDVGLSNFLPSRSIFGYSHPAPASRPAQIVTPPGVRASHTTFTKKRSPLPNSFTPAFVGSTVDMTNATQLNSSIYLVFKVVSTELQCLW
jgi:hypothetical protein